MGTFSRDGATLYYEVEGEGPLLVVLHGFIGSTESFSELSQALRRQFRVARLDLLGHGRSDAPEDPLRYGVWEGARDALALIAALGEERGHLLGYSLGGRIALRAALLAPERLRSLLIESGSPGIPSAADRAMRRASDEELARLLDDEGVETFLARWEAVPLFATQARLPPGRLAAQREARLRSKAKGLAQSLRGGGAGVTEDVSPRLGEIRLQTLLVAGARDQRYSAMLRQMARRLPFSQLTVVAGAGHNVHLERPRIYARTIRDFLLRLGR